jgi:MoaA/NifB/PqqE/SkfB family radical SAM enzyme
LDLKIARLLLRELAEIGTMAVVYKGGGEPTLHEEFPELLAIARQHKLEVGVVTNGSRLCMLSEEIVTHASYLRVSIDGPTAKAHNLVHGSDDFDQVIAGVASVVTVRGKRRHPVIGLSFAMDYQAIDLVGEAIALGDQLGVDYVLLRTPFFEEVGRSPTMTVMQSQEVRAAFEKGRQAHQGCVLVLIDHWISDRESAHYERVPKVSPRRGSFTSRGANGIEHMTGQCPASPLMAVVTSDGRIFPCCNLRGLEEWAIGRLDYDSGTSFRALWEGEQRRRIIAGIHRTECIRHCTHPMSKYNEAIEYLKSPKYHGGFV